MGTLLCQLMPGGAGAVFPLPYLMLSEIAPAKHRGILVCICNAILTASYLLPTLCGSWAINNFSLDVAWRVPFIVGGLPIVTIYFLHRWLPESPRWLMRRGRHDEVRQLVERLEKSAGIEHDDTFINPDVLRSLEQAAATERTRTGASWKALFRAPYLSRSLVSWSMYSAGLITWYVVMVYVPTILTTYGFQLSNSVILTGCMMVIGGAGSNATFESQRKAAGLVRLGVDGLLLITPYYNKSNEEGIYQHFKTVADAVNIPCILYNIPGRCGCGISERNVERLAAHPNIMGIKEASGNVAYAAKIAHLLSDDFRMYSGEDALTVPLMSLGASGTISVWADVQPQLVHDMCRAYLDGDVERARDIQIAGQPLINALFSEVNPIPVKEALAQMGMIEANYRMPLCPMADDTRAALTDALKGAGLLD